MRIISMNQCGGTNMGEIVKMNKSDVVSVDNEN